MAEQTLLAPGVVWRGAGFASRIDCQNPGEHSLKLGTPGLKDGRPLAFKATMTVCYATLNQYCSRVSFGPAEMVWEKVLAGWNLFGYLAK